METLLSTPLSSFISTPPLALSDRLQDLSLMFLGQEILKQNDTVSEPSGLLLHLSGMHCLEVSGKEIPFSPSKLLWRLISSTVTENLLSLDLDGVSASYVDGDAGGSCGGGVCVWARVCVCTCKIVIK